jgi:hypothetical protein
MFYRWRFGVRSFVDMDRSQIIWDSKVKHGLLVLIGMPGTSEVNTVCLPLFRLNVADKPYYC